MIRNWLLACALLSGLLTTSVLGQGSFAKLVGPVKVEPVPEGQVLETPYITWGGDVATFYANGGSTTAPGSIFQKQGLNLKLVAGDDFPEQVRRYLTGKTPLLRGTFSMIGLASEVLGSDPRTKPVIFLQLTWSAGDHLVTRGELKTLSDLKGKRLALQRGGPHVGMLDDILRAAKLAWSDVEIVWMDDLTGDEGPAMAFRKDAGIHACFVISPDMLGLTGGLESRGSGAEGTVKDARVLVSTAQMSRSIADVYACRKDYYDANRDTIEKFVAGYLKACEELVAHKKEYEEKGKSPAYTAILKLTQDIYGKQVIPTLEVDAHGLISDAVFVGLPGNISFFTDKGNLEGFEAKQKAALDLATGQGYAVARAGFFPPGLDYERIAQLGQLAYVKPTARERFTAESVEAFPDTALDERTILSFTINFEPNQNTFSAEVYGPEFLRTVQAASTFGNAVIAIRGHADPTKTLVDLIQAGMAKGIIKRTGSPGSYSYFFDNKPLDLSATPRILELIEAGSFDGANPSPRETMQAALNLSRARAEAVRDAIVSYAQAQGLTLDKSQIQPVGVGVKEPLIAKPADINEARQNMRVEFRLLKVPAEVIAPSDFDF